MPQTTKHQLRFKKTPMASPLKPEPANGSPLSFPHTGSKRRVLSGVDGPTTLVNSEHDSMTDIQNTGATQGDLGLLSSDEQLTAGIRVTRAEFSRIMGCSRQAVTDWVKDGRIVVGADGRFDPRQAVGRLLKTGDPAKIRAKVLEPLLREVSESARKINELEAALSAAKRDVEFNEGAANELLDVFNSLRTLLKGEWEAIAALPGDIGAIAVSDWLDRAMMHGPENAGFIVDFLGDDDGCF